MIGQTLSHFEITAKLGEGGMGEVYRALDTRLGREVAIKLLPAEFVDDAERLARFEREAQLLASLNHPNVAAIYGVEEDGGRHFLVLELVEGMELAERLAAGAIPMEEALELAKQVAEGLEAAHERGVVHRDLKPANLKLAGEWKIKILDLGLAKAQETPTGSAVDLTTSPTLTARMTQAGMVLGTAAYMSPEQAAGYEADRRADIWSFGVVLYEMLTGRRLFEGETLSHVLASVLKDEPDLGRLPAATPAAVRRLLGRCLRKKPRERLQAIGDARLVLEEVLGGQLEEEAPAPPPVPPQPPLWRRALPWALAGAAAVALAVLLLGRSQDLAAPREPRFLEISLTGLDPGVGPMPAISPDGLWIVYSAGYGDVDRGDRLYLRSLESFGTEAVAGTEGGFQPFWSPDGKQVGYFVAGELRRLELATRTSWVVCECAPWGRGGVWTEDGAILFAPSSNAGIHEVPAEGGEPVPLTTVDPELPDGSHRLPTLLPDGRHFLFTVWSNNVAAMAKEGGIYVGSRDGGAVRRLLTDASQAVFMAPDRLLLHRGGRLVALPFDPQRLEVTGEPVLVASDVQFVSVIGLLAVSVSRAGDLLYAARSSGLAPEVELSWVDRQGSSTPAFDRRLRLYYEGLDVTPDGSRFAAVLAPPDSGPDDLWAGEPERGTLVRLTREAHDTSSPRFSPDGEWVAFASEQTGDSDVYRARADGGGSTEMIFRADRFTAAPTDWPREDLVLLTAIAKARAGSSQIWRLELSTGEAEPILAEESVDFSQARLSPDGRWLAYVSNESRASEVYLRNYPDLDRVWKVSLDGGESPHWRDDSAELLFVGPEQDVLVMPIDPHEGPERPVPLFETDRRWVGSAALADHSRFLVASTPEDLPQLPLRLILDAGPVLRGDRTPLP